MNFANVRFFSKKGVLGASKENKSSCFCNFSIGIAPFLSVSIFYLVTQSIRKQIKKLDKIHKNLKKKHLILLVLGCFKWCFSQKKFGQLANFESVRKIFAIQRNVFNSGHYSNDRIIEQFGRIFYKYVVKF